MCRRGAGFVLRLCALLSLFAAVCAADDEGELEYGGVNWDPDEYDEYGDFDEYGDYDGTTGPAPANHEPTPTPAPASAPAPAPAVAPAAAAEMPIA